MDYQPPPKARLRLHYRDAQLLAVEKPAGLLSVPGRGADRHDSLLTRVQADWPQALLVHRLDMATSGLMLFALDPETQSALGRMFQDRQIHKRYLALVAGRLPASGEVDLPLIADWPRRPRQKVDREQGRPALTRYRRLAYDTAGDVSRVLLMPVTGRSHQLRVHMAALGHPILGDTLYADEAARAASPRLLLHAQGLAFAHPRTGAPLEIESTAPF